MMRSVRHLWRSADGSVAPIVALSLTGLIGVGGIAFDYAHMAALDTEMQQAADQAALAGATQLDGQTGAIARATAAAQSLISNSTLFANSGVSRTVTVPTITFCSAFDDSNPSTAAACTVTTDDKKAHVVWVEVGGRTANFALTPIVGALTSGTVGGEAVAGMNSAICKEPPVMMCNPNSNPAVFDPNSFIGKGMRLVTHDPGAGGGAYVPGDFGYLDVGAGKNDLGKLMGYGSLGFECVDVTDPSTEPGDPASVINAYNTRFDIYESGDSIGCFGDAKCPPSLNSRKDLVLNHTAAPSKSNCGEVNNPKGGQKGWVVSNNPYRPVTDSASSKYYLKYTDTPDAMGYPRDECHAIGATGNCKTNFGTASDRFGTGDWDIDTYWRVNHPDSAVVIDTTSGLKGYPTSLNTAIQAVYPQSVDSKRTYPTRYQVYRWEMANASAQLASATVAGVGTSYGQPVCLPPGINASATSADRRTIPIAVINCTGLTGAKPVSPIDWLDAFLVEPAMDRSGYTNATDIYVEVIGHTGQGTGNTVSQLVRHDRPYLIR